MKYKNSNTKGSLQDTNVALYTDGKGQNKSKETLAGRSIKVSVAGVVSKVIRLWIA